VKTSNQLITGFRRSETGDLKNPEKIREYIKEEILRVLISGEKTAVHRLSRTKPFVIMVVGSTGGEDNTIGKMAHQYASQGRKY